MPFITEELWQALSPRHEGESIMREKLDIAALTEEDKKLIDDMEAVKQVVSGVRTVRNQKNIAPKEKLPLQTVKTNRYERFNELILKMANLSDIQCVSEKSPNVSVFMVGTDEFAVPLGTMIDVSAELEKQEAQLKHLEGFLAAVRKKLSNERFVANAPEAVVALERKKEHDAEEKIEALRKAIEDLRNNQ